MGKNVIISVKGIQTSDNHDTNRLELVTEGKYYKKGDAYFVTYKESEVTGMEGTTTTVKVTDGMVTLMRFGSVNSQFIFQQGQKHVSYYDTTYGSFTIGVLASEVNIKVDDNGGEIQVGYQLEIDNQKSGENDFHMFIREVGHTNDKFSRECNSAN
ncbi:MAG: DUF1934 domain-containing protein [Clostridia bacterium]|nr:DUF1934 domain-containing protein [Clostridia bacterium]